MQQLMFLEPGKLAWREAPEPRLGGDGEALVRPVAAAPCDIDHHTVRGRGPFRGPHPIGHECVAEVLDVGDRVTGVRPGQLVAVPWHVNCGTCDRCRAGLVAYCRDVPPGAAYGVPIGPDWGGLYDEVVRVPFADAMLRPLPDGVTPAAAVEASDNLTIAVEFLGPHLRRHPGGTGAARVAVLGGGGSIALLGAAVARALGAARVLYLDPDDGRRDVARALGVEADPGPPRRDLGEFDVVFDGSADVDRVIAALPLLGPEGVVESAGLPFGDVPLPGVRSYMRGLTFHTGLGNAGPHITPALDLVRTGLVDPTAVLSPAPLPMADAPAALAEAAASPRPTKPVFTRAPLAATA